ncbi:MAG: MvaI/BcnI family restriction endonuclease [Fermentimonas sp.]|jgi:hypothetical protein
MKIYTKEELINELKKIRAMGWVKNARPGNAGGVGNTLEDLLGIEENNLPVPNAAEWELKCQRGNTSSLTTLFHMEPSPRALKFVPQIFLLKYGWKHQNAGSKYPANEMSFRQTIGCHNRSDRGFTVIVDRKQEKVLISFDATAVSEKHARWLKTVEKRVGLEELDPQPYWGFDDLLHQAGTKLHNCFYVQAQVKRIAGEEYFCYDKILMLKKLTIDKFLKAIENNDILVDFDARTGHNHGTKFRLRQNKLPNLYEEVTEIK